MAEPSANLIKRNRLSFSGDVVSGQQAYAGMEFLASTDERFRPVSLYDAPDGALYIVDMYRGIIQHKTYLTPYLKGEIGLRHLTQPLHHGRIYRVVPKGTKPGGGAPLPTSAEELVTALSSSNGWVRDYAQHALIDGRMVSVEAELRKAVAGGGLGALHAFWTLEGLGKLKHEDVMAAMHGTDSELRRQSFAAVRSVLSTSNYKSFFSAFEKMISRGDTSLFPYIAFQGQFLKGLDNAASERLLLKLVVAKPDSRYLADAVISGLEDEEEAFKREVLSMVPDTAMSIHKRLNVALKNAESERANANAQQAAILYPKGASLFGTICQTCHGVDGNGVQFLAPPLNKSEWVTGSKEKLIAIVLYGLSGPVEVNKHLYKAPEISGEMPGIGYDESFSDTDIAELLSYIRKLWENDAGPVREQEVNEVRKRFAKRERPFTVEELAGF